MNSVLLSALQRRFKKHFKGTKWEKIDNYFHFTENEILFCEYCGIELIGRDPPTFHRVPIIDHKDPKSRGGKNEFENVAMCCYQCNIVKGTLTAETFIKLNEILNVNPIFKEKLFKEWFLGRKAEKLVRVNEEETPKPVQQREELWEYV